MVRMKTSVISKAAYVVAHGAPARSGSSFDPEIVSLWNKLQKLQMTTTGNGGGEYIIVEPEKDEDLRHLRTRVYGGIRTYARRVRPATFAVRMLLRRDESHVLVWREPLPSPATVEQASRPEHLRENDRRPVVRGDRREKARPSVAAPGPLLTEPPRVAAVQR
jgi:hypothetical protein